MDVKKKSNYFPVKKAKTKRQIERRKGVGERHLLHLSWGVWRQSITLLEGPQASPACPSGKSIMKYK
jgi:hypothetical protein